MTPVTMDIDYRSFLANSKLFSMIVFLFFFWNIHNNEAFNAQLVGSRTLEKSAGNDIVPKMEYQFMLRMPQILAPSKSLDDVCPFGEKYSFLYTVY